MLMPCSTMVLLDNDKPVGITLLMTIIYNGETLMDPEPTSRVRPIYPLILPRSPSGEIAKARTGVVN